MDDLISREEATALIRAESDISMQNWKEHDDECSYGEMCAHDRDVDILQSLPSAQQWIPCKEALPKTDGHYLVSNSRNTFEAVFVEGEWYSMSLNLLLDGVLAWMPLPQPWEGGQDG